MLGYQKFSMNIRADQFKCDIVQIREWCVCLNSEKRRKTMFSSLLFYSPNLKMLGLYTVQHFGIADHQSQHTRAWDKVNFFEAFFVSHLSHANRPSFCPRLFPTSLPLFITALPCSLKSWLPSPMSSDVFSGLARLRNAFPICSAILLRDLCKPWEISSKVFLPLQNLSAQLLCLASSRWGRELKISSCSVTTITTTSFENLCFK